MSAVLQEKSTMQGLAALGSGFESPVQGAQQAFRTLLAAMARPGTVYALPASARAGLQPPSGIGRAMCAALLTLVDAETSLCLQPALASEALVAYLRFHTGVRLTSDAREAAFVALHSSVATRAVWSALNLGSDEAPQAGATLMLEVDSLQPGHGAERLLLQGPGIAERQELHVGGLGVSFWTARIALQAEFPRGVDLILTSGDTLAAVPRSTRLSIEAGGA